MGLMQTLLRHGTVPAAVSGLIRGHDVNAVPVELHQQVIFPLLRPCLPHYRHWTASVLAKGIVDGESRRASPATVVACLATYEHSNEVVLRPASCKSIPGLA